MQQIRVEEAVGHVLCHDITKIIPGEFKGEAFKKGHVVTESDIPELLKLGKEHLYVWELAEGFVHENDAGIRLGQILQGPGVLLSEPSEGKVKLVAEFDGICCIDEARLLQINMIDEIVVATRNNRRPVHKGDVLAGARVVPIVIDEKKMKQAESIALGRNVVKVKPFHALKVGIVTTGSEVYHGRIQDQFGPVVKAKAEAWGCKVIEQAIVPDDWRQIAETVKRLVSEGAELVLTTGGMSVDPDDLTPRGIREAGARVVIYGAPVLPGAMLMVAYLGDVPVIGLPGCVMYSRTTAFDLVLPLVLAGEEITRSMVARLGMGGLCLECEVCHYPVCPFGTGA